jgi:hypothetical protein
MTLPLTLWTQKAFLDNALVEQIAHGIFFGVLIGLLFYNLFLLVSLREASYLYFVILLASLIFEEATYEGYLGLYVTPDLYFLGKYFMPLSFSLLIGSMVLFSDAFLELKRRLPKFHWVNLVIIAVWGGLLSDAVHQLPCDCQPDGARSGLPPDSIDFRDRFLEAGFPPGPLLPDCLAGFNCQRGLVVPGAAGDRSQYIF